MPRVVQRRARKDYPREGIKAGDLYYYTKIKLQRGGIEMRSLKPFKESQLTRSPFKSGFLAAGEAWDDSEKTAEDIRAAAEAIRELGQEAQNSYDNMPEGLQQGDTGQVLENRASTCESVADQLDSLADDLEALEDLDDEPDDPMEPDDEDDEEAMAAYEAAKEEHDEWQTASDEREAEVERITDEAGDLISDMPE